MQRTSCKIILRRNMSSDPKFKFNSKRCSTGLIFEGWNPRGWWFVTRISLEIPVISLNRTALRTTSFGLSRLAYNFLSLMVAIPFNGKFTRSAFIISAGAKLVGCLKSNTAYYTQLDQSTLRPAFCYPYLSKVTKFQITVTRPRRLPLSLLSADRFRQLGTYS